ncbi:hypothetical protein ACIBBE_24590 [Streptomyces sp. NPDC051644]|uniref:hypothetical protein n=1 Tax=Streptomyces sp. NPDC051644 TaxID=3365666 RepID=UPI003792BB63
MRRGLPHSQGYLLSLGGASRRRLAESAHAGGQPIAYAALTTALAASITGAAIS